MTNDTPDDGDTDPRAHPPSRDAAQGHHDTHEGEHEHSGDHDNAHGDGTGGAGNGHGQHHDHDHDHHQHDVDVMGAAIVTVSSSRSLDDDPAGDVIEDAFEVSGHEVVTRELVRDDYDSIQGTVKRLVSRNDTDVVVTTGGTGITPDDVTVEAIRPLIDKSLPGFGELFRDLSRAEIGTRVVGTRATAGVAGAVPVFSLPGSENAANLGATEVIVPEAPHLAGLAKRDDEE